METFYYSPTLEEIKAGIDFEFLFSPNPSIKMEWHKWNINQIKFTEENTVEDFYNRNIKVIRAKKLKKSNQIDGDTNMFIDKHQALLIRNLISKGESVELLIVRKNDVHYSPGVNNIPIIAKKNPTESYQNIEDFLTVFGRKYERNNTYFELFNNLFSEDRDTVMGYRYLFSMDWPITDYNTNARIICIKPTILDLSCTETINKAMAPMKSKKAVIETAGEKSYKKEKPQYKLKRLQKLEKYAQKTHEKRVQNQTPFKKDTTKSNILSSVCIKSSKGNCWRIKRIRASVLVKRFPNWFQYCSKLEYKLYLQNKAGSQPQFKDITFEYPWNKRKGVSQPTEKAIRRGSTGSRYLRTQLVKTIKDIEKEVDAVKPVITYEPYLKRVSNPKFIKDPAGEPEFKLVTRMLRTVQYERTKELVKGEGIVKYKTLKIFNPSIDNFINRQITKKYECSYQVTYLKENDIEETLPVSTSILMKRPDNVIKEKISTLFMNKNAKTLGALKVKEVTILSWKEIKETKAEKKSIAKFKFYKSAEILSKTIIKRLRKGNQANKFHDSLKDNWIKMHPEGYITMGFINPIDKIKPLIETITKTTSGFKKRGEENIPQVTLTTYKVIRKRDTKTSKRKHYCKYNKKK